MRKRWIGIIGSLLLAAVGTLVLVQYVGSADTRAMAGQKATAVLVVTEPIASGSTVEEMAAKVEIRLIPANVHAPDSVDTLVDLVGQVTSVDLVPGEQVLASRFITVAELEAVTEVTMPPGLIEVTVALTPERALGGDLVVGDLVTVFASFEPFDLETTVVVDEASAFGEPVTGEPATGTEGTEADGVAAAFSGSKKTPNTTGFIIREAVVTNIMTVQGGSIPTPVGTAEPAEAQVAVAPEGEILVTIGVSLADAERLIFTAEFGAVWFGHESNDVTDSGTGVRTRISIYDAPAPEVVP